MSFLIFFSHSLSVASTLFDICCNLSSVAFARLKQLSRLSLFLYRISFSSICRSSSLHFSFLSICSNFSIKSPSSRKVVFSWLAVAPFLTVASWLAVARSSTCSSSRLVSVVIAETVPNTLPFSVVGAITYFSLCFILTIIAILSVNVVLFV